jgi:hypothetical protein
MRLLAEYLSELIPSGASLLDGARKAVSLTGALRSTPSGNESETQRVA